MKPLRALEKEAVELLELAQSLGKVVIVTNAMEPWVETGARNFMPKLLPFLENIPCLYARSVFDSFGVEKTNSPAAKKDGNGLGAPGIYKKGETDAAQQLKRSSTSGSAKSDEIWAKLQGQSKDDEGYSLQQQWKELVFVQELDTFYSRYEFQSWKNVVSIGDGIFERDAIRRVMKERPCAEQKKRARTKTVKLLDDPTIEELIAELKIVKASLPMVCHYDDSLDIEVDEDDLHLDVSDQLEKLETVLPDAAVTED